MSKDRSWSLMGWKRSQQRFLLEKDLQVAPLYLCNPRNDFAVRFSGYGYRCYSLLHGEPEFLLRKTLNESEINIVVTVARGVKKYILRKATCSIPIYFEAKPYKR